MKLVLVGDAHLASSDIKTRTDSSSEAGLAKLESVLSLASSLDAVAVIFTGDFLHHNRNNYLYLLRVYDLFERYRVPSYTIMGNHDLRGDDLSSSVYSQVRLCFGRWFSRLDRLELAPGVVVRGVDAYTDLNSLEVDPDVTLLVTHHWLSPSYSDPLLLTVPMAKSLFPSLRWLLAGHDHALHPVGLSHGVATVRPGSLVRVSCSADSDRIPTVAVLDTESGSVELVPVPHAAPFQGLFHERVQSTSSSDVVDRFSASLESIRELSSVLAVEEYLLSALQSVSSPLVRELVASDLVSHGYNVAG